MSIGAQRQVAGDDNGDAFKASQAVGPRRAAVEGVQLCDVEALLFGRHHRPRQLKPHRIVRWEAHGMSGVGAELLRRGAHEGAGVQLLGAVIAQGVLTVAQGLPETRFIQPLRGDGLIVDDADAWRSRRFNEGETPRQSASDSR
ncbi:hypothetical protein AK51_29605 [Serratia nematodiphila DZ0503SBS1]|nr:hypothetical protein AK51_29605 [Serratia nematodiphila DZ0503SBS1]